MRPRGWRHGHLHLYGGRYWLGYRFDDAGLAQVLIDGSAVATVDQYGPGRNLPFEWSSDDLFPGWHTIQIRVLGQRNPSALNNYINVAGFHAIGPPPSAVLVNRYSFATDASDSVGGQHGTLVGGRRYKRCVVMDGIKPGYVNLPNGLGPHSPIIPSKPGSPSPPPAIGNEF